MASAREAQGQLSGTAKRPARRETATEVAGKLVAFCRLNPDFWPAVQAEAKKQAEEHGHVCVASVFGQQRWASLTNADASPWRLNNSWAPVISRLLVAKRPELAPIIELRKSRFDALDVSLILEMIEAPNAEPGR